MNNNKIQAHAAIFFANVIFGLGVPVTKILLEDWVSPMTYMAVRCLGAAIIFWIIAAFMKSEHVERHDLLVIMVGGLMGVVVSQTLTAWALNYTSPVYFSLIATLTPVAVMLMAALFIGERITGLKFLGVLLGCGAFVSADREGFVEICFAVVALVFSERALAVGHLYDYHSEGGAKVHPCDANEVCVPDFSCRNGAFGMA